MFRLRKESKKWKQYAYKANQRHMHTQNQGTVSLFNKNLHSDFYRPFAVLRSFQILTHLILIIILYCWHYHYFHFIDKEKGTENLSDFPKITQLLEWQDLDLSVSLPSTILLTTMLCCLFNGSTKIGSKSRSRLCTKQHSMVERAWALEGDRPNQLFGLSQVLTFSASASSFVKIQRISNNMCSPSAGTWQALIICQQLSPSLLLLKHTSKTENLNRDQATKTKVHKSVEVIEIFSFLPLFMNNMNRIFSQVGQDLLTAQTGQEPWLKSVGH